MKPKQIVTQKTLHDLLDYFPETGVFIWKVDRGLNRCKNKMAGAVNKHGYMYIGINGKSYSAHRLAWMWMNACWPTDEIDHKDRNKLNNSIHNLRESDDFKQQQNMPIRKGSISEYTGVSPTKNGTWRAYINVNRKRLSLGTYKTKVEAIAVREEAKIKFFQ
jgi:hypothetical protein